MWSQKTILQMFITDISSSDYFVDYNFIDLTMVDTNIWKSLKIRQEDLDETIDIPSRSIRTEKRGWSHDVCKKISTNLRFPKALWDGAQQENIVKRFFNFYATGYIPNTHTAADIVIAAVALIFTDRARKPDDLIWSSEYKAENNEDCGFSIEGLAPLKLNPTPGGSSEQDVPDLNNLGNINLTDKERESALKSMGIDTDPEDLGNTSDIIFETTEERESRLKNENVVRVENDISALSKLTKSFLCSYKTGPLKIFLTEAMIVFQRYPTSDGFSRAHLHVFKVANFLALTMLRRVTKSEAQMINAFLKDQYKRNITSLIPGNISSLFAPPCKRCVEHLSGISKSDPAISSLLAKIVILWTSQEATNPNAVARLGAAVLTHTAWNRMGVIHLIFEVCTYHQISWKYLMQHSLVSLTRTSWIEIANFFLKYQKKTSEEKTVPWARVIDDSYFMRLNVLSHQVLAALMVDSIIAAQGDDGILRSYWASQNKNQIEYYRSASAMLTRKLTGTARAIMAGTTEAMELAAHKNRPQSSTPAPAPKSVNIMEIDENDL